MDIQMFRFFFDVVQTGSINKAAQINFVSSSSISRTLKLLEDEIGAELFKRSYTGMTLTQRGEDLFNEITPLLSGFEQIERKFSQHKDTQKVLHLTVCAHQNSVSSQAMLKFYNAYEKEHEYVDVIMSMHLSMAEGIKNMQNRYYMLGTVQYSSEYRERALKLLEDSSLTILYEKPRRLYVSVRDTHPLCDRELLTLEDIESYPRLAFIEERIADINYCGDLNGFDVRSMKKRILVRERAQLDEVLKGTDACFVGQGDKNIELLLNSGVRCIPLQTDLRTVVALVCRNDYILTNTAKRFMDIFIDTMEQTD